jgi:diguanylate cyclase (GGDEF)-like protein
MNQDDPLTDRPSAEGPALPPTVPRRGMAHATEPHILYPAIAVLALAAIWGVTLSLIKGERAVAERTAEASSAQLAETYEAQVVRALREIDQTLKIVKHGYNVWGSRAALSKLRERDLLPPPLLFEINITNSKGTVVASTHPSAMTNVADRDLFQSQREADVLAISLPHHEPASGPWLLDFSRRLDTPDGGFAGIVMLSVDASYFVSSYETSQLGTHGMLGLVGADGIFRIRRSGDSVAAGDQAKDAALWMQSDDATKKVQSDDETEKKSRVLDCPWDGVRRYITVRQLYGFPLAVVVGLSVDEQLAGVRRARRTYLWRASAVSLLVIVVLTVLGRMSRQLALTRARIVEERLAHAERDKYLAYHDSLTKLPNRSLFSALLGQSIHQAHRYNRELAVLFLDLDHFKHINDTLGHEAGDQVLQELADRVTASLRDSDTVARVGGDEFVILLPELDQDKYAATVAQKILTAVGHPFLLKGDEFRVTASIGISAYPQDGLDEQTLIKNADTAMYHAKEEGKNNYQFYSEKLNAESLERLTLETGLRHALEHHEFELHYQTKQDILSGRITGMEALLRWQHPDLGTLAPMQFIPVAEDAGLIVPIGKWVLRTACMQNVAWQRQGLPHLSMSVNMTARQFYDQHLLRDLAAILADTGMDAHLLELEISETLLMRDVERNLRILTELKDMGVRIAIDDFGIGYSSLTTLKKFPLDTIKIDRTYIRDVPEVAENKDLADAIIAMGRTLSLTVVAQGVETEKQAEYLRRNACTEFQGFYISKPVPAEQIADLLRAQAGMGEGATPGTD